jgi:hypothetical protein
MLAEASELKGPTGLSPERGGDKDLEEESPRAGLEGGGHKGVLSGRQLEGLKGGARGANDVDTVVGGKQSGGGRAGGEQAASERERPWWRGRQGRRGDPWEGRVLLLLSNRGRGGDLQSARGLEDAEVEPHGAGGGPTLDVESTGECGGGGELRTFSGEQREGTGP